MSIVAIIACLIAIVILVQIIHKNKNKRLYQQLEQFPSYPTYPLIGNTNMLWGPFDEFLERLENIMKPHDRKLFWVGPVPALCLKKYDDIATVLSQSRCRDTLGIFLNYFGIGVLSAEYEEWKVSRKLLNPAFNSEMVSKYVNVTEKISLNLVEELKSVADTGREIDVKDWLMKPTLCSVVENIIGISVENGGKMEQDFCESLHEAVVILIKFIQSPWLLSRHILSIYIRVTGRIKYNKNMLFLPTEILRKKLNDLQDTQLENRTTTADDDTPSKSVIDLLVKRSNQEPDFTETRMRDELLQLIIAGVETTSSTLNFLTLMLAINQDVQQKVYEEMAQFLTDNRRIDKDHLNDLRYLEQCILETLRIYTPVVFAGRRSHKDIVLKDNKIVPANVFVMILYYFANQDPSLYKNPLKWDPEHFNDEAVKQRPKTSQFGFGCGPRSCIGSKYAMMTMKIQMVNILSNYHLSSSIKELTKDDLRGDLCIRSKIGYPVKFTSRINTKVLK